MIHFKIIETETQSPDVLLYRDRNEHGQESVKIMAIGQLGNETETDMFVTEEVIFENSDSAQQYIADYSLKSANEFCRRNEIKYA